MKVGTFYNESGITVCNVWAPHCNNIELHIVKPIDTIVPLSKGDQNYWNCSTNKLKPGYQYYFRLNSEVDKPDPASHYQPLGVHGPSQLIDHSNFIWTDQNWKNHFLTDYIIYELHTGTFTHEGTFYACANKWEYLNDLGITAVEIMPVAAFPGKRNWGYDGVYPYAVQESYGGPDELKILVNTLHNHGIAVILDVVYNHLGPEGNYLVQYGPYFTKRYSTPWGDAINFDGEESNHVRNFFIQNALYWFEHYHIDALRLDAIHGIFDFGAKHFLAELSEEVEQYNFNHNRHHYLIAESDLNDKRTISPLTQNGHGIHAQWSDDFHHSVHALLTGEKTGYYEDFGSMTHLAKALEIGFTYTWDYSKSRKRYHGNSPEDLPGDKHIICLQNHDQVGNRGKGERLASLIPFDALKLAACTLFVTPYIPMIYMGEEFGSKVPFYYFIDHADPKLVDAVRKGRLQEFKDRGIEKDYYDPQQLSTFTSSIIDWNSLDQKEHHTLFKIYKQLILVRKSLSPLRNTNKDDQRILVDLNESCMLYERWDSISSIAILANFSPNNIFLDRSLTKWNGVRILSSCDIDFGGLGSKMPLDLVPNGGYELQAYEFVLYKIE